MHYFYLDMDGKPERLIHSLSKMNCYRDFFWDGRSDDGSYVKEGSYILRITAEDASETRVLEQEVKVTVQQEPKETEVPTESEMPKETEAPTESEVPKETEVPAEKVSIIVNKKTLKNLVIGKKEKVQLQAVILPVNVSDKKVTYTSSDSKVAVVDANGTVKGKRTGTAVITVKTANGIESSVKVTVKKAPKKITLNAAKKTLKKGKQFRIKVKLPKKKASFRKIFTSSNKKIASVNEKGKVTALKKGRAVITVKLYNGKKARLKITVR